MSHNQSSGGGYQPCCTVQRCAYQNFCPYSHDGGRCYAERAA